MSNLFIWVCIKLWRNESNFYFGINTIIKENVAFVGKRERLEMME